MNTVFLHIGYGKCGSTAIQQFAYRHFKKNAEIYLPETGWWQEREGHHHLTNNLDYAADKAALYHQWTLVAEELAASNAKHGFLTSEQFCFMRPEQIEVAHRALRQQDWQIKIIFFVRSQLELALSAYLEKLKHTPYQELGDFGHFISLHKQAFNFQLRITTWEELFGTANLIVRLYDRRLYPDVVAELCRILDLNLEITDDQSAANTQINQSMLPEFIPLIKIMDEQMTSQAVTRAHYIAEITKLSSQFKTCSSGLGLFAQEMDQMIEYYQAANDIFAEKFLTPVERQTLKRAFDLPPEARTSKR
ncbi:hypothetical protein [Rhabdochromatium marinum]|uniref:hypothetical protein n=1 Tax=Rhabdochromatium marinum TaxID=48729 RepID=UPI00190695C8|nr:hypothetical protein [Rhabdochromatium marinum]MBK1650474.1 hypothetical protein [Rhabdochromatium marinum]